MEKDPYFKPSVKVDAKQIIIIIVILATIAAIPFVINFVRSGGSSSFSQTISDTLEDFKIKTGDDDSPFLVTIPIINTELNLTVVKQNPQLVIYLGLAFITIAILVGVTLIRSLSKGTSPAPSKEE
jgi:hypothetical protein